ncbi:hypothetical protein Pint_24153 [Pistacia integerrima]|uniref:Uncharacterized protein n=1 Tax=Pistacia integerrima TaxID=434235 RepID=A0ACC0YDT6_9ROSI|nr:hypothetical protein Pint_24153 [Pistacia integerrima]
MFLFAHLPDLASLLPSFSILSIPIYNSN